MHSNRAYDENRVLQQLALGSEVAFTQIFGRYSDWIYNVALKFLKSPELAEEVVQEIFLKIWTRREEMVHAANFQSYLFTMARNQVFDMMKQVAKEATTRQEYVRTIAAVDDADRSLIESQYQELLHEAVNQLPAQQQEVFRLAKVEGLSHQAIAEQMRLSRLTVKTHMARALQSIRQTLEKHIPTISLLPLVLSILRF